MALLGKNLVQADEARETPKIQEDEQASEPVQIGDLHKEAGAG